MRDFEFRFCEECRRLLGDDVIVAKKPKPPRSKVALVAFSFG
jgi:hypothetical protein